MSTLTYHLTRPRLRPDQSKIKKNNMYIPIYLILFIVAVFLTNEKLKQKDLKNLHFYGTAIGFFGGIVLAIFAHAFLIKKINSTYAKSLPLQTNSQGA